ncbi:hypothetical protein BH20ACI2_BH20ACI2_12810 [soil metagenome]
MKPADDPGLNWIRKIRHEISAKFDHDPQKLGDHYRELEKKYADRLVKPSKREPEPTELANK